MVAGLLELARTVMAVTTDQGLDARFDMLMTEDMKEHVKRKGGAKYIRGLVMSDVLKEIHSLQGDGIEKQLAIQAYAAEMRNGAEDEQLSGTSN